MICLLGVDLGTSGTKTVLFDAEGREVASQSVKYPLYQPQNGWAEQDPRDWWNAAVSTIRGVLEKSGVNPGDVKGLGISGQMHGLVLLDENGEPDSVGYDQIPQPDGTIRFYFEFAGREGGIERAESYDVILSIANWEVTPEGEWLREAPDNTWLKDEWVVTVTPEMKGEAQ